MGTGNSGVSALGTHDRTLLAHNDQLRHCADTTIALDSDDGVKVNYGKFGDLLAEVKAVMGEVGDD